MPTLSFYMLPDEQDIFCEYIIDNDIQIVASLYSASEVPVTLNSVASVRGSLETINAPYLLVPGGQRELRMTMGRCKRDGLTMFFPMPRSGTPHLEFMPCRLRLSSPCVLTPGFLSHYATYWSEEEGMMIPAPQMLTETYRALASHIKTRSRRYCGIPHRRQFWVSSGTEEQLRSGNMRLSDLLIGPADLRE